MKKHTLLLWASAAVIAIGAGTALLFAAPDGLAADLAALDGDDVDLRNLTVTRLSNATSGVAADLIDELGEDHSAVAKGSIARIVRRIGPATGDAADLKAFLTSNDAVVRHAAAVILQAKPSLALDGLAAVARSTVEAASIRCAAVLALGNSTQSLTSVLGAIADDEAAPASLRSCALRALCINSMGGAVSVRVRAFDTDLQNADRLSAVRALATENCKSHDELDALAQSAWPFIQAEALVGIARTGDTTFLTTTNAQMASANAGVRLAALRATIELGGEASHKATIKGLIADAAPAVQVLAIPSVARTYTAASTTVITALKAQLVSANFRVRYEAALALHALSDTSGAAAMNADKASANQSEALMATAAHNQITGE